MNSIRRLRLALLVAFTTACGSSSQTDEPVAARSAALTSTCSAQSLAVADIHADFRDIWAGRETADTGKQADPNARVVLDFNATIDPTRVAAQFAPVLSDGTCGGNIAAVAGGSVLPSSIWGTTTSDSGRPTVPAPYNVLARESISGIVSAGSAVAAGGDITLSSVSVNSTVRQPVGLVAGGKVTLANGFVQGDITFGIASAIPASVSVSGTKSQQPFNLDTAFQNLEMVSTLLGEEAATGTVQSSNGTLTLNGTKSGLNAFQLSADALRQASTVIISVPSGAGALLNVSGPSVAIQNKGISIQGVAATALLWNMPSASFVQISGVGLQGSILAPRARLSFDSGSINGTLVVRNFQSSGSGSLQSAPLNVGVLLGPTTPSSVTLTPAQPLARGCAYQFVVPSSVALTATGNCLSAALGVTFRVAAHPSTPADRELAGATSDSIANTLRHFESRPGINTPVDDVWTRYASAIGVPNSSLVATSPTRPSPTFATQRLTSYQEYYQGYPVAGHGYLVATESGIFRSARGRVTASLPSTLPTPISESTALSAALRFLNISTAPWVSNPSKNHAPIDTLELVARHPNPAAADFVLVWDIRLAGTGVTEPGGLEVDAASGTVLGTDPGSVQFTFLDPNATYVQQTINTVDTLYGSGPQPIGVAQYRLPSGALATTLATGPQSTPGILATLFQPEDINGVTPAASLITDPTPDTPWTTTEAPEQALANVQWGLQRATLFVQSLGFQLSPGAAPFTSMDATGHQQVLAHWRQPANLGENASYRASISTADTAIIDVILGPPATPVEPSTIPHEFGHGFLAGVRRASGLVPDLVFRYESASLGEGLADLFGIASVHKQLGERTDWPCGQQGTTCIRDISNPPRNHQPITYLGQDFNFYANVVSTCTGGVNGNDFCSAHSNSTVISYWGYLLGLGSARATPNQCGLVLDPIDDDPDAALKQLLNVVYLAAGPGLSTQGPAPEPTFADFRDATIAIARDLGIQSVIPTSTARKIELAWYAVGLGPQFLSKPTNFVATGAEVTPEDDGTSVDPWQSFRWPVDDDGLHASAWDFQLADGPFDTNLKIEKTNITDTIDVNGATFGTLALALPFESSSRFYWRVRPHTTSAWLGCYPVHSFVATKSPAPVQNIVLNGLVRPDGLRLGGYQSFGWDSVPGATKYRVFISTHDPECQTGADVIEVEPTGIGAQVYGIQPEEHYFVNVQPVGPNDFTGNPSVGGCFKSTFDTAPLLPPFLHSPPDTAIFGYESSVSPQLNWSAFDGPVQFRLNLFEIDEFGVCGASPVETQLVNDTCDHPCARSECFIQSDCGMTFAADIAARNPTGYCWNVTSIASNGKESPVSETWRFSYLNGTVVKNSPGAQIHDVGLGASNPLGNDSYGVDVAFSWQPDPQAFDYMIKVARWPWNQTGPVDPPNCAFAIQGPGLPANTLGPLGCIDASAQPAFEDEVGGTSVILPAEVAGKGRYCWTLWPLLQNPNAPGTPSVRQPRVEDFPFFCYTTGPAQPKIEFDNLPKPSTPWVSAITGRVRFPYVPDAQAMVAGEPMADFDIAFDHCPGQPNAALFSDLYDCVADFTVHPPHQSRTYVLNALTWNSDVHPPVMDDSTSGPTDRAVFTTNSCGAVTQACCEGACDDPQSSCQNGTCLPCGGRGSHCCSDGSCNDPLVCSSNNVCLECGTNDGPCCAGNTCKQSNFTCQAGTCRQCGVVGAACCPKDTRVLNNGECTGNCKNGMCLDCGHLGQECCHNVDANDKIISSSCAPGVGSCVNNQCTACGQDGQPCCPGGGIECVSGTTCLADLKCHTQTTPPPQCGPGLASCGGSACLNPFNVPNEPGWSDWQAANPGQAALLCQNNQWVCNPTLVTVGSGIGECCPPADPVRVVNSCCPLGATQVDGAGNCLR